MTNLQLAGLIGFSFRLTLAWPSQPLGTAGSPDNFGENGIDFVYSVVGDSWGVGCR